MLKKQIVSLMLALCFHVAAWAAGAPDWVSGSSDKYPKDKYMLGIGIAGNPDAARSAARAEIAKVFKTRIMQESSDLHRAYLFQEENKTKTSGSTKSETNTKVITDEVIEGVEIAETYVDGKNKICYALAILDKPKLRTSLAQSISEQEEIIKTQVAIADQAMSSIEQARAMSIVLKAIDKKEELVARKRVVDPVVIQDLPTGITRIEVVRRREDALGKIVFVVEPDAEDRVTDNIASRISGLGFKIVPSAPAVTDDTSVIMVRCRTAVTPVERNNPQWKFYGWRTSIEMTDGKSLEGNMIAASTKEGQVSQLNEEAAKDKAITAVQDTTADMVEEQIKKYIFGEK